MLSHREERAAAVDVLPDFTLKQPRRGSLRTTRADSSTDALTSAGTTATALATAPATTAANAPETDAPAHQLVPAQREAMATESLSASVVTAEALVTAIVQALPATTPTAVVLFGLDNFRNINAAFGPEAGDLALARAGELLAWALAPAPVARLSSDTFGALLPHAGTNELSHRVARTLSLLSSHDLSRDGLGIRTTASAGITLLDRPGLTARSVLHEADLAMNAAKSAGRNRSSLHDAMETASAVSLQGWASQIRSALANDSFVLHAQRVQSVHSDAEQWELLLRLPGADGELLPPSQFLPLAERFGLAAQVDTWVTKKAIACLQHTPLNALEVNIGASTLGDPSFIAMVEEELQRSGINPRQLVFEVNGSVAGAQMDAVRVFSERLKSLGCRFALDGFGANSGALTQLKQLPLDFVKIDGSFVRHVATDADDLRIVAALTLLAQGLGCQVIAMNVSDAASQKLLADVGVDFVQGFHIGRPVPLEVSA